MSLYKRPGAKFWGYDFIYQGRRYQGTTSQTNKNAAKLVEAKIRSEVGLARFGIIAPKSVPFRDFMENRFLEHVHRHAKAHRTKLFYAQKVKRLLGFDAWKNLNMADITEEWIGRYSDWRLRTVGISSVNGELACLRKALNLALDWQLIQRRPRVRRLPGEKPRSFVVSAELEAGFLAAASYPLRQAAIIILDCGLRPEECVSLRKADIEFNHFLEAKVRTVARDNIGTLEHFPIAAAASMERPCMPTLTPFDAPKAARITVPKGKTANAARTVPLSARAAATIDLLCKLWPDSPWLFPGRKGQHFGRQSLDNRFTKLRDAESWPKEFVLHSLRHSFATRLAESGANPFEIAKLMGHSNITMTSRYTHPEAHSLALAMARKEALDRIRRGELDHEDTPAHSKT